ncbi:MAG TPA: two-component regulator propeller domain-containing protein [Pyrinomonadaceae bacterium]|nr:two-component regulator propeller domain-containing protein [Pyrinomonadaceae bacterium]
MSLLRASKIFQRYAFALGLLLCCLSPPPSVRAEQLPVRVYTSADGLGQNRVKRIVRDSRGFLWFCTADGLSRFDGYRFTTYDATQGIPYPSINDLLETRGGVYWIASNGGGVFRFNLSEEAIAAAAAAEATRGGTAANAKDARARSRFTVYKTGDTPRTNRPNRLFEDASGRIWAGTDDGVFVLDEAAGATEFRRVEMGARPGEVGGVWAFVEDGERRLWIATSKGLWRREADGRIAAVPVSAQVTGIVWDLFTDQAGRIWAAHENGLLIFKPFPAATDKQAQLRTSARTRAGAGAHDSPPLPLPQEAGEAYNYTNADGLPNNAVREIHLDDDGRIWLGTARGLSLFAPSQGFSNYTTAHGLSDDNIRALAGDRAGNLWIGTETGGAIKLARHGLVTYREAEGLGGRYILDILESRTGTICAVSFNGFISYFDGQKFNAVRPNVPAEVTRLTGVVEDHAGDWWVGTNRGLYRFSGIRHVSELARARPSVYTSKNGLTSDYVRRVFEDSRGDIWIGMDSDEVLVRWERASGKFQGYSEGLPRRSEVLAFAEDRAGNVWIGFREGGAARYRNGRFDMFDDAAGLTADEILKMYADAMGRLWFGSNSYGLVRIDDPSAERPVFRLYTTAEGLTSGIIRSIAEDGLHRLYLGTSRSVDRFDLATGRIKRYTTADGLAANESQVSYADRQGTLWFGTWNGISRLIPEPESPSPPPPVMIDGLQIAGVRRPVSDLGEARIENLQLRSDQNQVQIDFLGLGFAAGEVLRYRYKLEGAGAAGGEWSAPNDQRSVTFANLSPGSYRFLVRAVNTDGVESAEAASVAFVILRPFWQRPWFVTLAALALGGLVFAVYRYRIARLVELERVRTRIATDLHDDIGSSLSQIAILSEVVSQRVPPDAAPVIEPLSVIAGTSREMVDSMSDIVWAINPQRDHLRDLTQRMRRFASDILSARDISFRFRAPDADQDIRLGADLRREVYLIFKECVNNLVKHSECREVELELRIVNHWIVLRIADDGRGFDVSQPAHEEEAASNGNGVSLGGHGLLSMRRRAAALGGTFEVESERGRGTTSTLKVPARRGSVFSASGVWRKLLRK